MIIVIACNYYIIVRSLHIFPCPSLPGVRGGHDCSPGRAVPLRSGVLRPLQPHDVASPGGEMRRSGTRRVRHKVRGVAARCYSNFVCTCQLCRRYSLDEWINSTGLAKVARLLLLETPGVGKI